MSVESHNCKVSVSSDIVLFHLFCLPHHYWEQSPLPKGQIRNPVWARFQPWLNDTREWLWVARDDRLLFQRSAHVLFNDPLRCPQMTSANKVSQTLSLTSFARICFLISWSYLLLMAFLIIAITCHQELCKPFPRPCYSWTAIWKIISNNSI